MTTLTDSAPTVKLTFADDLADAVFTDADEVFTWELGPSDDDASWNAEQSTTWDDQDADDAEPSADEPSDADWDSLADDSQAIDAHERGFIFA